MKLVYRQGHRLKHGEVGAESGRSMNSPSSILGLFVDKALSGEESAETPAPELFLKLA